MQLRTGLALTIIAAAAGAATGRATVPHEQTAAVINAGSRDARLGGSALVNPRALASDASVVSRTAKSPEFGDRARSGGDARAQVAVVYVAGAVTKPGIYTLRATARADEAVRAAGGATAQADLVAINLAARIVDGEEIAVPIHGAQAIVSTGAGRSASKQAPRHSPKRGHRRKRRERSDAAPDDTSVPTEMVDINAADEATLETLPGVGASLAERIVAFRDLNGPFASSDELLDVGGMTTGKIDALAPYVTFH